MPFLLAHGGAQIQIEQTRRALEEVGVTVEWLRWWDAGQKGDVIHYFGRPILSHIQFAHEKGMSYVMAELLSGQGSRALWKLHLQKTVIRLVKATVPKMLQSNFNWNSYHEVDALVVNTGWEARVAQILFGAPADKLRIVPNGVDTAFFLSETDFRDRERRLAGAKWLICLATPTERKRVVETAESALLAGVHVHFIGKPYGKENDYFRRFIRLVEQSNGLLRYEAENKSPEDLAPILKQARGLVLLSTMETQSVAALAAVASGCPLFLSDLPWARSSFGENATYCPLDSKFKTAAHLKVFHDAAPGLPIPSRPATWKDVAAQLREIYAELGRSHYSVPR